MAPELTHSDVARFKVLLHERFGLTLERDRDDQVSGVLRVRMAASGCRSFSAYQALLSAGQANQDEFRALAAALTVGETFFFRNSDHFEALAGHALPERLSATPRRPLKIVSAGCSSGEEAYSIAMLLNERFASLTPSEISIVGTDINPTALKRAGEGMYNTWSLRETPLELRERYFRAAGRDFMLDPSLRRRVSFEERNLFDDDPTFFRPASIDIVFCRNVLIYFSTSTKQAVISRLANSLVAGGFLFLGHSESLRGISKEFVLVNTHDTFYYQRRDVEMRPASDGTWFESIQRSAERITSLSEAPRPSVVSEANESEQVPSPWRGPPSDNRDADVEPARELYRQERFADALAWLQRLPEETRRHPEVHLLLAAILTNQGELSAAEESCRQVLQLDNLNAGAHYLTAVCREHAGDLGDAAKHDRMAIFLDPGFAMPRLHLGRLARRNGDRVTAERELAQALNLLVSEDKQRIALYCGGFSREALAQLCRNELLALGQRS